MTNPAYLIYPISNVWCLEICAGTLFLMLLKFGAVLSVIRGFLMAVYTWTHLLQCIAVVRSFLRMLKLCKQLPANFISRGWVLLGVTVLDYALNLHRNIPLTDKTKFSWNLANNPSHFLSFLLISPTQYRTNREKPNRDSDHQVTKSSFYCIVCSYSCPLLHARKKELNHQF